MQKPKISESEFPSDNPVDKFHHYGLSKRELFAAMAMQGQLANPNCAKSFDLEEPVKFADKLILALGDPDANP